MNVLVFDALSNNKLDKVEQKEALNSVLVIPQLFLELPQ